LFQGAKPPAALFAAQIRAYPHTAGALPRTPPKGAALWKPAKGAKPLWNPAIWSVFRELADEERAKFWREYLGKLKHSYFNLLFAAEWMQFRESKE
jgi:hypothetical protein